METSDPVNPHRNVRDPNEKNPGERLAEIVRHVIYSHLHERENHSFGRSFSLAELVGAYKSIGLRALVLAPLNWIAGKEERRRFDEEDFGSRVMVTGGDMTVSLFADWNWHVDDHHLWKEGMTVDELHHRLCAVADPQTMLPPDPQNTTLGRHSVLQPFATPFGQYGSTEILAMLRKVRTLLPTEEPVPREVAEYLIMNA